MASYLQVENISKYYGDRNLFSNISFNINEGDKIALIAPNGSGKSTILSILAGKDSSDMGGKVRFMKEIRVHFLEQEQNFNPESSIFEILLDGNDKISEAIREYERSLASKKTEDMDKASAAMDATEAWNFEHEIRTVLSKLELEDGGKLAGMLSGGERKRVAIASMILSNADFLIMDEPTNHLDLKAIEFLEDFLKKSRCTLLMVTHDRYFLDRVCNHIIELDNGSLYEYKGNYQYFLEKKQERAENLAAEKEKARNLYRKELDWIRRMPCARGTKAKYRVESFESIREKAKNSTVKREMEIKTGISRVGKKIIECTDVCYCFGDKIILDRFSYKFGRYEKIGIVGENGIGKTTFLKLLTGEIKPLSGEIQIGETVRFGHYSQSGIVFDENQTIIEHVREIAETVTLADGSKISVTSFLNHFLFAPNTHNTKIAKLSGGEKRRLYLLTILMKSPNFLILDEPTNDLDIITLNILEEYLTGFQGPMIIVAHDRYFLDKITDHLFVFTGNGEVKDFPGTYTEYREYAKELEKVQKQKAESVRTDNRPTSRAHTAKKKLSYKERIELEELDKAMDSLNREKCEIEQELSSGKLSSDEIISKSARYSEIKDLLDEKELRWLELEMSVSE